MWWEYVKSFRTVNKLYIMQDNWNLLNYGGVIKFGLQKLNAVGFLRLIVRNYFTAAGALCLLYADTGYVICDHLGDLHGGKAGVGA